MRMGRGNMKANKNPAPDGARLAGATGLGSLGLAGASRVA
jgi:hypothetical protein